MASMLWTERPSKCTNLIKLEQSERRTRPTGRKIFQSPFYLIIRFGGTPFGNIIDDTYLRFIELGNTINKRTTDIPGRFFVVTRGKKSN